MAGATGYIGSRVAQELLAAGYDLICPVRDPDAPAARELLTLAGGARDADGSLHMARADVTDRDALFPALDKARSSNAGRESVNFLVSCLASRSGAPEDSVLVEYTANRNLLDWSLTRGVKHFTLLSAICVQKPRLAFQNAKLRFEGELAASGLPHSIVRATAFFKSLSGQVARVRDGKAFLLFGSGEDTACKPIAEADLARYLRLTLEDPGLRGVLPIGGPGPAITPLEQARVLAKLSQRPLRVRSVPPQLLLAAARVLSIAGLFSKKMAAKAEFARIGHYYATESMLLWDEQAQRYDARATPEFGSMTLAASYRAQLAGEESQDLATHAMFD
ncbi:MAG: NAD-dependent epimerase/dehydratase family protein [Pseudomonadota bacterium]